VKKIFFRKGVRKIEPPRSEIIYKEPIPEELTKPITPREVRENREIYWDVPGRSEWLGLPYSAKPEDVLGIIENDMRGNFIALTNAISGEPEKE